MIFSALATAPFASASDSSGLIRDQDLSYLSIRSVHIIDGAAPEETASMLSGGSVDTPAGRHTEGGFSSGQAKLMRDLSHTIDVIPGGVRLCLNIHY